MNHYVFTSVSEGHPDRISDAILDAYLAQDKHCRVACETLVKGNNIIIAGEISSTAHVDHEAVARCVVAEIGYNDDTLGFASSSQLSMTTLASERLTVFSVLIALMPGNKAGVIKA